MITEAEFRKSVNSICETLPGAQLSDPWGGGHDAWKLCDKMFASIGQRCEGVSVKTPDIETASLLIDAGQAQRAPYFHKSWVRVSMDAAVDDLKHRIETSYSIIRSGLSKKKQASLPPWPREA